MTSVRNTRPWLTNSYISQQLITWFQPLLGINALCVATGMMYDWTSCEGGCDGINLSWATVYVALDIILTYSLQPVKRN